MIKNAFVYRQVDIWHDYNTNKILNQMKTDPITKYKIENLNKEFLQDLHKNSPGLFKVVKRTTRRNKNVYNHTKNYIGAFGYLKLNSANSNEKAKDNAEQIFNRTRSQSNASNGRNTREGVTNYKQIDRSNRTGGSSNLLNIASSKRFDSNKNSKNDSLVSSSQNQNDPVLLDVISEINDLLDWVSSEYNN